MIEQKNSQQELVAKMIAERFANVRKQVDGTKQLLERLESPDRINRLLN